MAVRLELPWRHVARHHVDARTRRMKALAKVWGAQDQVHQPLTDLSFRQLHTDRCFGPDEPVAVEPADGSKPVVVQAGLLLAKPLQRFELTGVWVGDKI